MAALFFPLNIFMEFPSLVTFGEFSDYLLDRNVIFKPEKCLPRIITCICTAVFFFFFRKLRNVRNYCKSINERFVGIIGCVLSFRKQIFDYKRQPLAKFGILLFSYFFFFFHVPTFSNISWKI